MKAVIDADEVRGLLDASIAGNLPDERGRFGPFGGRYVPETLVPAFERLEKGIEEHLHTEEFQSAYRAELRGWVGRPTALTHAPRPAHGSRGAPSAAAASAGLCARSATSAVGSGARGHAFCSQAGPLAPSSQ